MPFKVLLKIKMQPYFTYPVWNLSYVQLHWIKKKSQHNRNIRLIQILFFPTIFIL